VAQALRLAARKNLGDALKLASTRLAAQRRVDAYTRRFEKAPSAVLADRIIEAYLLDLNSPAKAQPYLDAADKQAYKQNIPLAAKPIKKLSADEAAQLGRWYHQLAGEARAEITPSLLQRARDAYARAVDTAEEGSMAATRTKIKLDEVTAELGSLGSAASIAMDPSAATDAPDFEVGQRYDFMRLLNVKKDAVSGEWMRGKRIIYNRARDGYTHIDEIAFPVEIDGSYQASLLFSIDASVDGTWGYEETWLLLPVGDGKRVSLRFPTSYYGPELGVGAEPDYGATALQIGKPQRVSAQVKQLGDEKVSITVFINDRKLCAWSGRREQCADRVSYTSARGAKNRIGLASREVKLSLAKLQVKLLDGKMSKTRQDK
jgi:hypothetical protein